MSTPIDPRILNLSYSSLLTLHNCPREFQLYKLQAPIEIDEELLGQSITFAYGTVVGNGVQNSLQNASPSQIIFNAFLDWSPDLFAENTKQNKSFFKAVHAINQFSSIRNSSFLRDWELVTYNGKPACELSFVIEFPDGFKYRGFVDAVLRHSVTGEVLVLEVKTTASPNINPTQYKNSAQAIGYSIVLDAIFPELSSYKVLYCAYSTTSEEYNLIPFDKSYYQRALWIRELLLDIETIKLYEEASVYPMHGESCFRFFRECNYFNTCTLSTERITSPLTPEIESKLESELSEYQIKITLADLISAQISKDSAPVPDSDIL